MNITTQHVASEEGMAFVDGELSATDTRAVSMHIEACAECAKVTEQLRRTSQALASWKVSAVPARVEDSIAELAAKAGSGAEIRKPKLFVRASFWSWKQWAGLSAGAVSALLFVAAMLTPNLMRTQYALKQRRQVMPYVTAQLSKSEGGGGGGGDRDNLQVKDGALEYFYKAQSEAPIAQPQVQVRNGPPQALEQQVAAPMIARTVSLSIITKTFSTSRSSLDMILARYRGYSAQLTVSTTENAPRSLQASLRIPASALSSAISDLKALGRVEKESQSGEEVTQQHTDLVARLKNSRETEQRLREILQQRTGKITDVLKVEEEIARVRGEIEEMEAEQKALEHRVDFATVELQLAEEYKAQLNPPAPSVSTRIHNAFVAGYQNASESVLGILLFFTEYSPTVLIWLAILALPVVVIWRRYRRISAGA